MRKREKKNMSLTLEFCNSPDWTEDEQLMCHKFASDLHDIISDLDKKGYLRSTLELKQGEEERRRFIDVMLNIKKMSHAFNMFFDTYVDKVKPDSQQRLMKFFELNKPYGLTEEDLYYLLVSEMVSVFYKMLKDLEWLSCS